MNWRFLEMYLVKLIHTSIKGTNLKFSEIEKYFRLILYNKFSWNLALEDRLPTLDLNWTCLRRLFVDYIRLILTANEHIYKNSSSQLLKSNPTEVLDFILYIFIAY